MPPAIVAWLTGSARSEINTVPFDRGILVLQAVHYGPSVTLHCIVVRLNNLL